MRRCLGVIVVATVAWSAQGQIGPEPAYRVTRPTEGITCFGPGLELAPNTTCVVETDAGLVVVDTGLSPSMAKRTRTRIVSLLNRKDFQWVINTHAHFDHSGGNQVYEDATIVGHENAPATITGFYEGRERWIERRIQWLARQEAGVAEAPAGSHEALAYEERLRFNLELIDDLGSGYLPTPPNLTFSDGASLRLGDVEVRLLYFGRAHTDSDILVHIPSERALFTGDLFAKQNLGVTTYNPELDPERWLEALDAVFEDESGIKTIIGGHGLQFSPEWILAQRRYLGDVWQAVNEAKAKGSSIEMLIEAVPFDDRFDYVAVKIEAPVEELKEQHGRLLRSLWRVRQTSAAESNPPG